MTLTLNSVNSVLNTDTKIALHSINIVRNLCIRQTNGLGEIKEIVFSNKEADELREWLNRNLSR